MSQPISVIFCCFFRSECSGNKIYPQGWNNWTYSFITKLNSMWCCRFINVWWRGYYIFIYFPFLFLDVSLFITSEIFRNRGCGCMVEFAQGFGRGGQPCGFLHGCWWAPRQRFFPTNSLPTWNGQANQTAHTQSLAIYIR